MRSEISGLEIWANEGFRKLNSVERSGLYRGLGENKAVLELGQNGITNKKLTFVINSFSNPFFLANNKNNRFL